MTNRKHSLQIDGQVNFTIQPGEVDEKRLTKLNRTIKFEDDEAETRVKGPGVTVGSFGIHHEGEQSPKQAQY
jgi:hypothetical protein